VTGISESHHDGRRNARSHLCPSPRRRSYCIREGRSRIGQQPAIDERRLHHKFQAAAIKYAVRSVVVRGAAGDTRSRVESQQRKQTPDECF
jgi:hypothetical protein